ncbi:MAG: hypothetical protein IJZ44_05595 [Lachnospiraceae bacterium]|nr:hypothetical protein [Lachnospiraceae bacterium]
MKKVREYEASVSVYAVLVFTVILSLVLLLVETARENAVRMKLECAMDLSLYSVFAEYNRQLQEQYDLFFVDTSYGYEGGSPERTKEHLWAYMDDNFTLNQSAGIKKDLLQMQVADVQIVNYSLASDNQGLLFKRQAVSYMKDAYGLTVPQRLQTQLDTVCDRRLLTRDITGERLSNQSIIDNYEIPPRKIGENEWEEVELQNPADGVNGARGILGLVLGADTQLSTVAICKGVYISERDRTQGSGLVDRKGLEFGDELIFNEYLLDKCGSYTEQKEGGLMQYQLEYILEGKEADVDNLKAIVSKLLFLREVDNVTYLFADAGKVAEAEALALAVTSAVASPELTEPVKISLLFAWAYAESVYDVRVLLEGGKVPLVKSADTWHYSLSGMLGFATDTTVDTEHSSGLTYEDYLRIFLALEDSEKKTMRAMDIVEMDIRNTAGNKAFCMDCCMDYMEAEVVATSAFGYQHSITRKYYYY